MPQLRQASLSTSGAIPGMRGLPRWSFNGLGEGNSERSTGNHGFYHEISLTWSLKVNNGTFCHETSCVHHGAYGKTFNGVWLVVKQGGRNHLVFVWLVAPSFHNAKTNEWTSILITGPRLDIPRKINQRYLYPQGPQNHWDFFERDGWAI